MNQPEFPTVFRGYDPVQVDAHVAALHQAVDTARREAEAARQEAAESSVQLTKVTQEHENASGELEGHRSRVAELEQETRKASSPTFADLGERIGAMLGLADEEAAAIREGAAGEAEEARRAAEQEGQLARAEADRYVEEIRNRADTDAAQVLSRAKAEADSIIDDAAREAAARREEAEAYFEHQRAIAASQAADFEKTLGDRREQSAAEFNDQMAKQDDALRAVQERADLLGREAEEDHRAKTTEANRLLESARNEAAEVLRSAREHADRVRRDSDRELAAATARRDSITAQLSNVRNMLATLGGPAAAAAATSAEEPEPTDADEVERTEGLVEDDHDVEDEVETDEPDGEEDDEVEVEVTDTEVDEDEHGLDGDEDNEVEDELEADEPGEDADDVEDQERAGTRR